jgi:hypothetical protein
LQRNLFIAVVAGLFAVQSYMRFQSDIIQDAAWFIYIADQLLLGKALYADIVEVNPPLGIWLIVPIVWIAEKLHVDTVIAVNSTLLAASGVAVWYCDRLLRLYGTLSPQVRRFVTAGLIFFILFFPAIYFAEREHFMVLLFLPWLFLRIIPDASVQTRFVERLIVGLLAGAAICIKPQSLFAPLLVELLLFTRSRDIKSFVAIENLGAVSSTFIYGVAVLLFAPKFLTEMLTLGTKAYVPFYGYPLYVIAYFSRWTIPALIVAFVTRNRLVLLKVETRIVDGLLVAALGFLISYFVQMKGFGYQIMPADILANFASFCAVVKLWELERRPSINMIGAIAVPLIMLWGMPQTYKNDFRVFDILIARDAPQAKSIFIASTRIGDGFPLVQQRNLIWASRLPTQWLAPYVDAKWQGGTLPDDEIVQKALDWTVSDLITFTPDFVMIDITTDQFYIKSGKFEFIKFWQNDKRFPAFWSKYKYRETVSGFDIFSLAAPKISTP